MPAQADTVSILIAAFNAEATLARAVNSALTQACVIEVIVIDDASSDQTAEIADALARVDQRVRVLRQSVNAGPAAARNAGLSAASGAWIGVLDADDYFQPGRVAHLLDHADRADFLADNLLRTSDAASPAPAWRGSHPTARAINLIEFLESNLGIPGTPLDLGFVKPLMRRAFLEQHRLAYQDMRLGEDYELYARALILGARFLVSPSAGYVSVEREGSLSKVHSEADLRRLRDCDDQLAQLRPLTSSERRALKRHRTSVDNKLQWRLLILAVKMRAPVAALKTFHSPQAAVYLTAKLGEQAWVRLVK